MSNLSDIKRRLVSVKQTRQITGAMETVSIAKMRKSGERSAANKPYADLLRGLVADLARASEAASLPIFLSHGKGKKILLVVSSDKGLCGGFNHEILKTAQSAANEDTVIMPIGMTGGEHFKNKPETDMRFAMSYVPDYVTADKVGRALLTEYSNGAREIAVVYSRSNGQLSTAVAKTILPVDISAVASKAATPCLEPSPQAVCDILLPLYTVGIIYEAFLSNSAAEHGARRAAMSAATESADKLIAALSMEYNRARQSAVTEQMTEIIGATTALTDKRSRQ